MPSLSDGQRYAARRARTAQAPECYRWIAAWWRLEAQRGYPSAARSRDYADAQIALWRDMVMRPEHYASRPAHLTDWQWSGLALQVAS